VQSKFEEVNLIHRISKSLKCQVKIGRSLHMKIVVRQKQISVQEFCMRDEMRLDVRLQKMKQTIISSGGELFDRARSGKLYA
jgi:hypothetical protein